MNSVGGASKTGLFIDFYRISFVSKIPYWDLYVSIWKDVHCIKNKLIMADHGYSVFFIYLKNKYIYIFK